jgi:hypothetical protein
MNHVPGLTEEDLVRARDLDASAVLLLQARGQAGFSPVAARSAISRWNSGGPKAETDCCFV